MFRRQTRRFIISRTKGKFYDFLFRIVTGGARGDFAFRIVRGHGAVVLPILQKAHSLPLGERKAEIGEDCVTSEGRHVNVHALVVFKVGDDSPSIANAARCVVLEQSHLEERIGRIFAPELKSIIGGLTVEQTISERERVAQETRNSCYAEIEELGVVVDALQIQEIEDDTGYIHRWLLRVGTRPHDEADTTGPSRRQ